MKTLPCLFALLVWALRLAAQPASLPDTRPLTMTGDLSAQMHAAAIRDIDSIIEASLTSRAEYWHRDVSSREKYEASIRDNREHFKKIIGLGDSRVPVTMERFGSDGNPALVAETKKYRVFQVRWPIL